MGGINSIFNIGTQSMAASKSSMATSNHNVANLNTKGYSKQRVEVQPNTPLDKGNARIGNGVHVAAVTRSHSEFLDLQVIDQNGKTGHYNAASTAVKEIERLVNEQATEKLNKNFSEFFNAFRELSGNPESEGVRKTVIENARVLVRTIQDTQSSIDAIRDSIDFRIDHKVSQINDYLEKISHLNTTIALIKAKGAEPNDEMDQRDLAIRELSKIVQIRTYTNQHGFLNINMGDRVPLITGNTPQLLSVHSTPADSPEDGRKRAGASEIFTVSQVSKAERPVRTAIVGGEISGLLEVRDTHLNDVSERLEDMVHTFATYVNFIHRQGYGRDGISGRDFFANVNENVEGPKESSFGIMHRLGIAITDNSSDMLATALTPNSPGDNRVSLGIAALEKAKVMDDGQVTLMGHFSATVGMLGTTVKSLTNFAQHNDDVMMELEKYRESLVGVSMDEEASKMVQLQHQFNAAAKMLTTADEMLGTVLNLKR